MLDKNSAAQTLGVSFLNDTVRCAHLSYQNSTPYIQELFTENGNVKRLYTIGGDPLIVTGISAKEVLVRQVDVQLTKLKDIEAVLSFQAEPLLPYPVEESLLDYIPQTQTKAQTRISLIATEKAAVQSHLEAVNTLSITPEVITCAPAALALFGYYFGVTPKSTWPQFVIHVGISETYCVLQRGGRLLASHNISIGSNAFASKKKDLELEIGKTIYALAKQSKVDNVTEILLCGPGVLVDNFSLTLSSTLKTDVTLPAERYNGKRNDLIHYAESIGYALSAMPTSDIQVNFRQQDYSYPNPWKRFKQPALTFAGTVLALTISLYLFGASLTTRQETKLKQQYASLLEAVNKPYSEFEREFQTKVNNLPEGAEIEVPKLKSLSQKQIEDRVDYLAKEIQSIPDTFFLLPSAPKASDVLAWISNHPNVKGDGNTPLLDIQSFSYSLVKRPDNKKRLEKYLYKVDLEFSTDIPKNAREFHDALIAPNDFIDPKSEIKWSQTRDQYKTSFFLKNRQLAGGAS